MRTSISAFFQKRYYLMDPEGLSQTLAFFSEERKHVRNAIEQLSWELPEDKQKEAICYLSRALHPCEYIYLVMPGNYLVEAIDGEFNYYVSEPYKDKWENAAKVLVEIGWPKVEKISSALFTWLFDPNWPGSQIIYDFLCKIPKNELSKKINEVLLFPDTFDPNDYEELKEQLHDLCDDVGILLGDF